MAETPATVADRAFVWLQHAIPQHLMTAFFRWLSGVRLVLVKNALIRGFVRLFKVPLEDVARPVPGGFADFNDFFTRELADGARPIDSSPASIVCPVDGIVSATGEIVEDRIFQVKGRHYRLDDLLATDLADAAGFENGRFATLYLAPWNYHRVHTPLAGELTALRYVPGSLYSVNDRTVRALPGLFARNERLAVWLKTEIGAVCVIFVGALNVGSITTPWTGRIIPRKRGVVDDLTPAADDPVMLGKGALLGWFNMGSSVIVLLPPGAGAWHDGLDHGERVTMGTAIGTLAGTAGNG
jgi:phosphatidylserine decarboxylase